jgi:hypothetical protein
MQLTNRRRQEQAARHRHPTALVETPAITSLRTMRSALDEAWAVLDEAMRAPLAQRTREALGRAQGIINNARHAHPAGTDRNTTND